MAEFGSTGPVGIPREYRAELEGHVVGSGIDGGNWFDDIGHGIRHASHEFGKGVQTARRAVRHGIEGPAKWTARELGETFQGTDPTKADYDPAMGGYCTKVQDEHDTKLTKFIDDSELNLDNIKNRNKDIGASVSRLRAAQRNVQLDVATEQGEQGDGDSNPYSSAMTPGGPVQEGGGYIDHVHSLPTTIKDLVLQHGVPALNNAMYNYAYPESSELREAALMKNMTEPNWASSAMFGAGHERAESSAYAYGFIDGGNFPGLPMPGLPHEGGTPSPSDPGAYPGDKVKKGIDDETGPTPKEKEAAEDRARLRAKICGHTLFGKAQACGGLDTCDKAAAASYKMGMANYEAKARGEIDEMRDAQHHSLSQDLAEARAQNSVNLARAQAQAPGGPGGPSPYD